MSTNSLIKEINEFADLLCKAAKWDKTELSVAPVIDRGSSDRGVFYIFEFYCMIRVVDDLARKYDMNFQTGKGEFTHRFPQAAANKKDKPSFCFSKEGKGVFDIFGGVYISGEYECEEDHPDISFFKPNSPDEADSSSLLMIMDAKYVTDEGKLSKSEPSVFECIIRRFKLTDAPRIAIEFDLLAGIEGNSLLTNGEFHADKSKDLDKRLKEAHMKEVANFKPDATHEIAGL